MDGMLQKGLELCPIDPQKSSLNWIKFISLEVQRPLKEQVFAKDYCFSREF